MHKISIVTKCRNIIPHFLLLCAIYCIVNLDATDLRLLDLLQTDASLSNQDLAARAHTSPATALRRVRRLA